MLSQEIRNNFKDKFLALGYNTPQIEKILSGINDLCTFFEGKRIAILLREYREKKEMPLSDGEMLWLVIKPKWDISLFLSPKDSRDQRPFERQMMVDRWITSNYLNDDGWGAQTNIGGLTRPEIPDCEFDVLADFDSEYTREAVSAQQRATAILWNRPSIRDFFNRHPHAMSYTLATMGGTYLVTRDEVMSV